MNETNYREQGAVTDIDLFALVEIPHWTEGNQGEEYLAQSKQDHKWTKIVN